jgi:hypothetical protein
MEPKHGFSGLLSGFPVRQHAFLHQKRGYSSQTHVSAAADWVKNEEITATLHFRSPPK